MTRYYLHDSVSPPVSYVYLEGEAEPIGYLWRPRSGVCVAYAGKRFGYGDPVAACVTEKRKHMHRMPGWATPPNVGSEEKAIQMIVNYVLSRRAQSVPQ